MNAEVRRKPGRPRAIPESMVPEVLRLYDGGLGYRAIAREMAKKGIDADWSTVRRIIKAVRSGGGTTNDLCATFTTVLPLGISSDVKKSMDSTDIGEESAKKGGFQRARR